MVKVDLTSLKAAIDLKLIVFANFVCPVTDFDFVPTHFCCNENKHILETGGSCVWTLF